MQKRIIKVVTLTALCAAAAMLAAAVIILEASPFQVMLLAVISIVVTAAVCAAAKCISSVIMKPVKNFSEGMSCSEKSISENDLEGCEELLPAVRTVRLMRSDIAALADRINKEKNTISLIMGNMAEGMILLDESGTVLSVNRSAEELLSPEYPIKSGRNIMEFSNDDPDFLSLVRQSKEARNVTGSFSAGERFLRVFISRIDTSDDENSGYVIIVVDETEMHLTEAMRRDFSANVSHELRTPLTTVRGFGEMLANGMAADKDDVCRYGKRIYDESSRLLSLINDIMRLSEIEENSGGVFAKSDILATAKNVCEELAEKAAELDVALAVTGDSVTASVNQGYIFELIYNLAENGIKYNRAGGHVNIVISQEIDRAVIIVSDDGIGIPKVHQGRIFERFYRVDKSHSKQTGGTGLGLSIVKHIVAYHHGSITVESDADKGTRFTVSVPVSQN